MNKNDKIIFDSMSARHKDENGFLHVDRCHITKEQVVPYYGREIPGWRELGLEAEKMYNVYRPAEELKKGYATFNGLPLLLEHHPESAENPQKMHRVGSLGDSAEWNPPYIDVSLHVTDQAAIDAIEQGRFKELSAAYQYEPVLQSGRFDDTPYDIVMKNIRGNHVALVREGRAGPDVVVADAKPRLTFASWYLDKFGKKVLTNRALTMDCKNWLRQHLEAVKEVLPNEHRVFRDALRDRAAFDSWFKGLALDSEEDGWFTTKNGHKVKIDDDGTVLAGFGGKYNGQNIKDAHGPKKNEQPKTAANNTIKLKNPSSSQVFDVKDLEDQWSGDFAGDKQGKEFSEKPENPSAKQLKESLPVGWSKHYGDAFLDSVDEFTGGMWEEHKYDPVLDYGIRNSTLKWDKGELYRGLSVSPKFIDGLSVGGKFRGRGIESWSSNVKKAKEFADGAKGNKKLVVIDKTKGERNAVPVSGVSEDPSEKEALYAIDQEFTVRSKYSKGGITYIEVEAD